MFGQAVEVPLVRLPPIALGDYEVEGHVAGVADLGDQFDGILGPALFEEHAVTTDPDAMTLTVQPRKLFEPDPVVPLDVRRDGVSVDPLTRLVLPNGPHDVRRDRRPTGPRRDWADTYL